MRCTARLIFGVIEHFYRDERFFYLDVKIKYKMQLASITSKKIDFRRTDEK